MENIMKDYAAFERAMDRDRVYVDLSFKEICWAIEVDAEVLDWLIFNETGFHGGELVDFYRTNFG